MSAPENTRFSSAGENVIERVIEVEADETADHLGSSEEFEDYFEIDRTANEIVAGGHKRVSDIEI